VAAATAAAVVAHPLRIPHAVLATAAAAVAGAAAVDGHTASVVALAISADAMMTADADADTDAERLLGQSDCRGAASVPLVSASAQSATDSGGDDVCVKTDVDADCWLLQCGGGC
jgi:hypothetical protein